MSPNRRKLRPKRLECGNCGLYRFRSKIVFGRGKVPADILFLGEAPGKSEDLRGKPFIGPSGKLLRDAIRKAASFLALPEDRIPSYYITNVVCCRPTDFKDGPNRPPTEEEVWACRQRLEREILLANPCEVIFLGKVAEHHGKRIRPDGKRLYHPAYILRRGGRESAEYRDFVRELVEVFERVRRAKGRKG